MAFAREVRAIAAHHGHTLACDHNHVRRWREGHASRAVPPRFIAEALSRRLGRGLSLSDVGMDAQGRIPSAQGMLEFAGSPAEILSLTHALCGPAESLDRTQPNGPLTALAPAVLRWLVVPPPNAPARHLPGRPVTSGDIDRASTMSAFDQIDRRSGGAVARLPAVEFLRVGVVPLLGAHYTGPTGRDLYSAAALCTYGIARYTFDADLPGLASRYAVLALSMAHQADDQLLGAYIVALLAEQALLADAPQIALTYVSAALTATGEQGPRARAGLHAVEARVHARLDNPVPARAATARAERGLAKPSAAPCPAWLEHYDHGMVAQSAAQCALALGNAATARRRAEQALGAIPADRVRDAVVIRLYLAAALARQGSVEESCEQTEAALLHADGIESSAVTVAMRLVAEDLQSLSREPRTASVLQRIGKATSRQPSTPL
ncbi:hypothetical protein GXW82_20825 [Streptacidiphilus sp. 4-A2]|nr:hypothetical protein [Streptacidiphilus sp. 4-A2]